jgi:hypothetical protein
MNRESFQQLRGSNGRQVIAHDPSTSRWDAPCRPETGKQHFTGVNDFNHDTCNPFRNTLRRGATKFRVRPVCPVFRPRNAGGAAPAV